MKSKLSGLLILVITLLVPTGCGGEQWEKTDKVPKLFQVKLRQIGFLIEQKQDSKRWFEIKGNILRLSGKFPNEEFNSSRHIITNVWDLKDDPFSIKIGLKDGEEYIIRNSYHNDYWEILWHIGKDEHGDYVFGTMGKFTVDEY